MSVTEQYGPIYERSPRRGCQVKAILSFGDISSRVSACVENMSATGAAVRLIAGGDLHAIENAVARSKGRVLLILPADKMAVEATAVWQGDGRMGIHFEKCFEPFSGKI